MNFLSIDCSTDIGSLFLKTKSKTFSKILQSDKSNNDLLMKRILVFFEENNIKFDDISAILVNQGPGNFSGLRGSIAIAKGISLSKNLRLYGYDKFLLSCAKFINKKETVHSLIKYRQRYFIKKFEKNLTSASNFEEITKEKIIKKYNNDFKVIIKNDAEKIDEEIIKLDNINIVELDHNVLELLLEKDLLNENLVKPIYLT